MRIHYLQHERHEPPGNIIPWAGRRGHALTGSLLCEGDDVPSPEDFDWLIVMGGSMNVYEEEKYPWLTREKRLIGEAIEGGRVVLGICLGAQLIADVMGAPVSRSRHKEIGWFPIELTAGARQSPLFAGFPRRMEVFHWHEDTFDVPSGAERLAGSEACENQGFLYGDNVVALQFHLEMTYDIAAQIIREFPEELAPARFVQPGDRILSGRDHFQQLDGWMDELLSRLETLFPAGRPAQKGDSTSRRTKGFR